MVGMILIFWKLSGDFSRMMSENGISIIDISYNIRMKEQTKGIALCQNLWPDSKPRPRKRCGIENRTTWNMRKGRIFLSMSLVLRKYISEWIHRKKPLSGLLFESLSTLYHP